MRFVFSSGEELKPRPDPALDGDTTEEDEETQLLREDFEAAGYATLRNNARFGAWESRTEAFPMQQNDSLQMFELRPPRLCVGGLIKVAALLQHTTNLFAPFSTLLPLNSYGISPHEGQPQNLIVSPSMSRSVPGLFIPQGTSGILVGVQAHEMSAWRL